MKKKSYLKSVDVLSYPTVMVWIEAYSYYSWFGYVNGKWGYNPREIFVPGRWVKRKNFEAGYQEKGNFYITSKYRWYRKPHTMNERRASFNEPETVRPKRRANYLPNSWDDIRTYHDKSWKTTHKCRKQWMKNL